MNNFLSIPDLAEAGQILPNHTERIEFLEDLIKLIKEANSIAIVTHIAADGDALGSSFCMALALEQMGKSASVFLEEPVPKMLNFLPGQYLIVETPASEYDLAMCLDTSDMLRLGKRADIYSNAKRKITIDHHSTNNMEADILWIDEKASAVGEMIYNLIKALGIQISRDMAICLYTAIVTDTGGFRYSNTRPESHIIAAHLLLLDIPFADIAKRVFDIISYSKMVLLKKTLQNLTLYFDGKVAVSWITYEDILPVKAQNDDFEGLVNIGRNLEGVEVSLFLREETPGHFKGSLRANEYVDVAYIAELFSGGGHKRAAGFSADGILNIIISKVIAEIEKVL
jgi:phosphoesterase RecJ-like protein